CSFSNIIWNVCDRCTFSSLGPGDLSAVLCRGCGGRPGAAYIECLSCQGNRSAPAAGGYSVCRYRLEQYYLQPVDRALVRFACGPPTAGGGFLFCRDGLLRNICAVT